MHLDLYDPAMTILVAERVEKLEISGDPDAFAVSDFQNIPARKGLLFRNKSKGIWGKLVGKGLQAALSSSPQVEKDGCVGCGHCAQVCPAKAITMEEKLPRIVRRSCIRCFCCQKFCPKGAMKVKRTAIARLLNRT